MWQAYFYWFSHEKGRCMSWVSLTWHRLSENTYFQSQWMSEERSRICHGIIQQIKVIEITYIRLQYNSSSEESQLSVVIVNVWALEVKMAVLILKMFKCCLLEWIHRTLSQLIHKGKISNDKTYSDYSYLIWGYDLEYLSKN